MQLVNPKAWLYVMLSQLERQSQRRLPYDLLVYCVTEIANGVAKFFFIATLLGTAPRTKLGLPVTRIGIRASKFVLLLGW